MFGPYITDWIAALICWPHVGVWRSRASHLVWYSRVRLDSMTVKNERNMTRNCLLLNNCLMLTNNNNNNNDTNNLTGSSLHK